MTTTKVQYRDIPGFPGYRVGSDGSVWSALRQRPLGPGGGTESYVSDNWRQLKLRAEKKTRYLHVSIRRGGRYHRFRVHTLVLWAFIGPRPAGKMCCHRDDNPTNNALSNLRWDTHAGNAADAVRNGRRPKGESAASAKLTAAQVREVRRRFASGERVETIAPEFGLTPLHVHPVARGTFYSSVVTEYDDACRSRDLRKSCQQKQGA